MLLAAAMLTAGSLAPAAGQDAITGRASVIDGDTIGIQPVSAIELWQDRAA
jgi:hypothetical protein